MITVIAGTNRKGSMTRKVAEYYRGLLADLTDEDCHLLSMEDVPPSFVHDRMYEKEHQDEGLAALQDQFFTPAEKLVFVVPEYNGSFPGMFKLFIDAISVRNYKENFQGKKVALVGVASGRAGNLRGLDHLTTSLNYLKMNIFPNRLPLANIEELINEDGLIVNNVAKSELKAHVAGFLAF